MTPSIVDLGGPCTAAAASGDTVWCAAGGRLLAFEAAGRPRLHERLPAVRSLGAAGAHVAAVVDDGAIVWLDPRTGRDVGRRPIANTAVLVSGGGAIWAIDQDREEAWRLGEPGTVIGPIATPGVDRAAADGDRLWWLSRRDGSLRDGTREIDLGVRSDARGGLVVCANSVWVSVAGGLLRIGAWNAVRGALVPLATAPLPLLTCGGGVLVGGSSADGVVVLDPLADADVRRLGVEFGAFDRLVATRATAWVFSARHREARLAPIRTG